jgi:hypothetical protein
VEVRGQTGRNPAARKREVNWGIESIDAPTAIPKARHIGMMSLSMSLLARLQLPWLSPSEPGHMTYVQSERRSDTPTFRHPRTRAVGRQE